MPTVITLTTDFGLADGYVGAVKGAILSINPGAVLVDITHTVPPQDVFHGAFVLATAFGTFPPGTVHVAVVDPGVGGKRRCIAAAGGGYLFVGPDNGVLSLALGGGSGTDRGEGDPFAAVERTVPQGTTVVELLDPAFHRPSVSSTFHGRDIFGPVAGHISRGIPVERLGPTVHTLYGFPAVEPIISRDGTIRGTIVHIDGFGNAVTNIRHGHVTSERVEVRVGQTVIPRLSPTYVAGEGAMALWGSSETLEIAIKNGHAARDLGLRRGGAVVLRPVPE